MRPSEGFRRTLSAVRGAAATVLPVAAVLSAVSAPALCGAPGATTLGKSVLPPLPLSSAAAAVPEKQPIPPALSGSSSAAEASAPASEPASPVEQLAASRREAVAAARRVQKRERALAAIRHEIDLRGGDADAGRRGLDESRTEQVRLLGTVMHLARNSPTPGGASDLPPVERLRAEALMREVDPALRDRLRVLAGEIARIEALQRRIAAMQTDEAAARQALKAERERLAAAVARRNALLREMLPPQGIDAALRIADMEREATGIDDLIKRAEAAEEGSGRPRERGRPGRSRNKPAPPSQTGDPTRPNELRSLAAEAGLEVEASRSGGQQPGAEPGVVLQSSPLVPPVAGTVVGRRGGPGAPNAPSDGLSLKTVAGAAVVAPFDGRIVYAGPFRDFGRILIIRHDRRYYSVLAGLGRIDAKLGDWVLAGEPVGAVPDIPALDPGAQARESDETDPGRLLYYELRHDGRPVDPQPWLASVEDGHDERNGKQKVSQ